MTARRAMTLFEIVVALGMFTVLMAAVLECLTGVRRYVDRESVQNDLVVQGRRLIDEIVEDLAGSAWYIPPVSVGGPDEATSTGLFATQTQLQRPDQDRQIKYYPYIQVRSSASTSGLGLGFQAFWFPAEVIDPATLPSVLPATHRQPSQEIVFVKIADAPASNTPPTVSGDDPPIRFGQATPDAPGSWAQPYRLAVQYGWQLSSTSQLVTTYSLGLRTDASGHVVAVPVRWESAVPDPQPRDYREYAFVVVPDAVTGKGRLERRYRNGSDATVSPAPVTHRVLSRDVDRIVFNTYRTEATLGINQIRVAIYLSRALEDGSGYVTHEVEVVVAMRAIDDALSPVDVQERLGGAGTFTAPVTP